MPNLRDINDLLPFLAFLRKNKIWFSLDSIRDDTIMITLTLFSMRIEIDIFQDHIEYSCFNGDESVHDDIAALFALIARDID